MAAWKSGLTVASALAFASPAMAQYSVIPDPMAPDPRMSNPTDHGLTQSPCGSLANEMSSVCRNGMVRTGPDTASRSKAAREADRAAVHAVAEQRAGAARALAARVKGGATVPPALVEQVRAGLLRDLELWRAEYGIADKAFADAKARWMREAGSLSPAEWVLWRAAWFDERDRWIASAGKTASR